MTGGYYRMHRGWMDHPMFKPEPYTDREAFMWLIENAAWKDGRKRVGAITVEVKRGQVAASLRFMACAWKWQEPKVRRFLSRMKIDAAIDAASDAGVNVITICNYDKFQTDAHQTDAPIDAAIDAASTQTIRKKEVSKEEDTEAKASGAVAPPVQGDLTLVAVDGETPAQDAKRAFFQLSASIDPSAKFRTAAATLGQLYGGDYEAAMDALLGCDGKADKFVYLQKLISEKRKEGRGGGVPQWKQPAPKGHTGMWNGVKYERGCPLSSAAI